MARRINRMAFTRGDGLYAPGINRSVGAAHGRCVYDGEGIGDWISKLFGFGAKAAAKPSNAHWLSHFAGGRIRKRHRKGGLVSRTWIPKKMKGINEPPFDMRAGRIRRHKSKRKRARGIYA